MDIWPILIATASILVGILGGRLVQEILEHILLKKRVKKLLDMDDTTALFGANLVKYIIYLLSFIIAISQFPVGDMVFNIAAIIMCTIFLGVIMYSLKDFISNSFSGFLINKNKIVSQGETIEVSGIVGKVTRITLIFTEVELGDGSRIILPNSIVANRKIIKRSND